MMANEQDKNPGTGQESDISKAQATQQPAGQQGQQAESGQQSGQFESGQQDNSELTGDQAATGQAQSGASPDEGLQGDTLAQQRTDVEGGGLSGSGNQGGATGGQAGGGFVGSQGQQDSSSELIDDEDEDFAQDGQGAPEGK